jgi:hypothetical protein
VILAILCAAASARPSPPDTPRAYQPPQRFALKDLEIRLEKRGTFASEIVVSGGGSVVVDKRGPCSQVERSEARISGQDVMVIIECLFKTDFFVYGAECPLRSAPTLVDDEVVLAGGKGKVETGCAQLGVRIGEYEKVLRLCGMRTWWPPEMLTLVHRLEGLEGRAR